MNTYPSSPEEGARAAGPDFVPVPGAAPQPAWAPGPAFGPRLGRPPRLRQAGKTVNRMCLLMLLQQVVAVVIEVPLLLWLSFRGRELSDLGLLLFSGAMSPVATALPCLLCLLFSRQGRGENLLFEKTGFFPGILWVLGGLGICLLGNFPAMFLSGLLTPFGYQPEAALTSCDSWPLFVTEFLTTAVLVPVMEEFAFRGVIFSALKRHGSGFAVVVSAAIFAAAHMSVTSVAFAFVAGLGMGFVYAKTRNLWLTVCIHALNNAIAVISQYGDFLFGPAAEAVSTALFFIPLAIGLLALIILLIVRRKVIFRRFPVLPGAAPALSGGEGAGCVVRAPFFWVMLSLVAVYTATLFV